MIDEKLQIKFSLEFIHTIQKSMAKLGYCEIDNLKLSRQSKGAVFEIHDIMYHANLFSTAMGSIPFVQIFMSPSITSSPLETGINIREYDWQTFGDAMGSVPKIVRYRIRSVAEPMSWYTGGKEGEFWRCISEAAL
ncbi:hypothetical protein RND59_18175 [Vibrio ruber]|uniref:hypothetical protein n=1 Tax=Vibrio ruber TaxID=184755 RepID=UPI002892F602|nr:hypothetical protein [Vibrio ruber]WNJ98043.1 hypothetical protein RND59_18175 [Vibrio ruber]